MQFRETITAYNSEAIRVSNKCNDDSAEIVC